jgi:hypothetical protein
VLHPDEVLALAETLGPDGELVLNPLLAGIDPAEAWAMLDLVDRAVLPHLSTSARVRDSS